MTTLTKAFNNDYPKDHDTKIITAQFELARVLDKLLEAGEITFDYNGHHRNRKEKCKCPEKYDWDFRHNHYWEERVRDEIKSAFMRFATHKQIKAFANLLENPGKQWVELNGVCELNGCSECGKYPKYKFDGRTIKTIGRCPHPKGEPEITFNIKVPSGVMVFANYFDVVPTFDDNAAYNRGECGYLEHVAELNHYASHGVAQVFCGNSCPGVHKQDDHFYIGSEAYDDDDKLIDGLPGERVASICTDLWAWSMTDLYRALEIQGEDKLKDNFNGTYSFVRVAPGTYEVTQKFYSKGGYGPSGKADCFATMRWVEPSDVQSITREKLKSLGIKGLK